MAAKTAKAMTPPAEVTPRELLLIARELRGMIHSMATWMDRLAVEVTGLGVEVDRMKMIMLEKLKGERDGVQEDGRVSR